MSSETAILLRFTAGAAKQILSGNKEIAYNGTCDGHCRTKMFYMKFENLPCILLCSYRCWLKVLFNWDTFLYNEYSVFSVFS